MKTVSSKLMLTFVRRINQRDESLEARRPVMEWLAMIQTENDKNLTRVVMATERRTET